MLKINYHPRPYYVLDVTYTGNDPHRAIIADLWHGHKIVDIKTVSSRFIATCEHLKIEVPPLLDINNLVATSQDGTTTIKVVEYKPVTSK